MRSALTIAGSDSSGGAGIQADIKTMSSLGVYAQSAITALTAQNTEGVLGVWETPAEFLELQMKAVFEDIRPDVVKIGMIPSCESGAAVVRSLERYGASRIVLDPVMVATSGARLIEEDALGILRDGLLPLADIVTPNIPEACVLSGVPIHSKDDMATAAAAIFEESGTAVLVKGGHWVGDADDFFLNARGEGTWLLQKRVETGNTHGTGCTLSSAIASYLALGFPLEQALRSAKAYLTRALEHDPHLGKGSGPLNHLWNISRDAHDPIR